MKQINLQSVDLNLLVVFDALMTECHVTRAADRMGLTQPAMSHALNRLRELIGDPLFVRAPRGMTPTPAALELAGPVRSILDQIETTLALHTAFDPARGNRRFTLGMSDYAAFLLLPNLAGRLGTEAPGVDLVIRHTSHVRGLAGLDNGEAELIVGNFPDPPAHLAEETLFVEDFICAARAGHPDLEEAPDLRRFLSMRHLQVSLRGEPEGYLDDVLRRRGLKRIIGVTVGHFLLAPFTLQATDLIATEPRRLMTPMAGLLGLRLFPPPLDIPAFRVVQMWHRRYDRDPGHRWLRGVIRDLARSPAPAPGLTVVPA